MDLTFYKGSVLEESHYYPFGLTLTAQAVNPVERSNVKFQAQRLEDDFGLNWYGYKYRMHDMQIGRFTSIDPLSSRFPHNSCYGFSENKVVRHIELEGLESAEAGGAEEELYREDENFEERRWEEARDEEALRREEMMRRPMPTPEEYRTQLDQILTYFRNIRDQWQLMSTPGTPEYEQAQANNGEVNRLLFPLGRSGTVSAGELSFVGNEHRVDLMGGPRTSMGSEWTNYDQQSEDGIKDDVSNFGKHFGPGTVSEVVVNNPQAEFLNEVYESLAPGARITVRGQMANKFFKTIWNGTASGISNYRVVPGSQRRDLSNQGFYQSDGIEPLRGTNNLNEIILEK